jgi:ribokinase
MPAKAHILVVGSSNTDLVVFCDRLPNPGETVLGGEFRTFGGGKGANQAVAAARAGGDVTFLGAHGPDAFGTDAKARLQKEGINTDYFQCVQSAPSGIALILVDGVTRENLIAVAKSSNDAVDSAMVSAARPAFEAASAVISQLEIRDGAIEATARLCHELGKPFILNPAPSRQLPKHIYESLQIIVLNEHEVRDIAGRVVSADSTCAKPNVESSDTALKPKALGHQDIPDAISALHKMGCKNVVVTLGAAGVMFSEGAKIESIAAPKVQPVDTTGAGDCFVGWLGVGIGEGLSLRESVRNACIAASLAVTRAGAQDGMPYRHEVGVG